MLGLGWLEVLFISALMLAVVVAIALLLRRRR